MRGRAHQITTTWYLWPSPVTTTKLPDSTTPAKRTHSRVSLLLWRIAAASLLHAALAPSPSSLSRPLSSAATPPIHLPLPPSSFRAAANTSRPRARSSRSLCLSFCRWPCRNSACWPCRPRAHDLLPAGSGAACSLFESSISCKQTPASACPTPAAAHHLHRNGLRALFLL